MGGLISGIVSGATDISTAIGQGKAESEANDAQLARERQQANVAIDSARERGAYESGKLRIQGAQVAAKQKVAYANSGVDATSGTAAAVQADTAALSEFDAQRASINAARDVWGFQESKKQSEEDWQMRQRNIGRKQEGQALGGLAKGIGGIFSLSSLKGGK